MAFSLDRYVRHHFRTGYKESGNFLYVRCVYCEHDWKMWVNVRDRRPWFHCFRCLKSGDQVTFIMQHQHIDRREAVALMASDSFGEIFEAEKAAPREVKKITAILPKEYRPVRLMGRDPLEELAFRYLTKRRGLRPAQIALHRIGYAMGGKYDGYIIVPVTRGGEVVYFVARAYAHSRTRYLNPDRAEVGRGKAECIFNFDRASAYRDVVITEGVFDAMAVGDHAMAILGKSLSDVQEAMLLLLGVTGRVGVMLDSDAESQTHQLVEKLGALGFDAYPLLMKEGDPSSNGGHGIEGEASFTQLIRARMART